MRDKVAGSCHCDDHLVPLQLPTKAGPNSKERKVHLSAISESLSIGPLLDPCRPLCDNRHRREAKQSPLSRLWKRHTVSVRLLSNVEGQVV